MLGCGWGLGTAACGLVSLDTARLRLCACLEVAGLVLRGCRRNCVGRAGLIVSLKVT